MSDRQVRLVGIIAGFGNFQTHRTIRDRRALAAAAGVSVGTFDADLAGIKRAGYLTTTLRTRPVGDQRRRIASSYARHRTPTAPFVEVPTARLRDLTISDRAIRLDALRAAMTAWQGSHASQNFGAHGSDQKEQKEQEQPRGAAAAFRMASSNEDGSTAAGNTGRDAGASPTSATPERNEERPETGKDGPGPRRPTTPTRGPSGRSVLAALVQKTRIAERITDAGALLARLAPDLARLQRDGVDVSGAAEVVAKAFRWATVQTALPFPPVLVRSRDTAPVFEPRGEVLQTSALAPGRGPFKATTRVQIPLGTSLLDIGQRFLAHLRQSIADRAAFHAWCDPLFEPGGIVDRGDVLMLTVAPHVRSRLLEHYEAELHAAGAAVGRRVEWQVLDPESIADPVTDRSPTSVADNAAPTPSEHREEPGDNGVHGASTPPGPYSPPPAFFADLRARVQHASGPRSTGTNRQRFGCA